MNKATQTSRLKDGTQYFVGIGASAGGLEALQKLLSSLSDNTGFSYVIIQHLSPDYKSLLGEILSKYTSMPVIPAEDGMEVEKNCVYVIQPGKNMQIINGKLSMRDQREHELNLPIDIFLRSLAEDARERAIAVILSGTGSDGSNGIRAIKENDGMIIVQDCDTAKFDGMPRSAMRTGLVDALLSPEQIAIELSHIAENYDKSTLSDKKAELSSDDEHMVKIYKILQKVSNINFSLYKQTTILRRIERRMMLTHKTTLEEYVEYLYQTPIEVRILSKELLIGVTNFFRDSECFQTLKEKAIRDIVLHCAPEDAIRIWIAGCSTGEEAYSVAILVSEVMDTLKIKRSVKIFATDLDVESITSAGKGFYSDSIISSVSPARLSKYFTRRNGGYTVNRDIRKMIVFSPHNIFHDPPFGRLDLISCRNMLIYFQPVLQNDVFEIFHVALRNSGYLFLGKSETTGAYSEVFPPVDAAAKLFTHRSDIKMPGAKSIPYLQSVGIDEGSLGGDSDYRSTPAPDAPPPSGNSSIDISLLEQFMPACLVVNEKNEIVHVYGENSNYIHLSAGKFTNSLYNVLSEALKIPVSTILKQARTSLSMVEYKSLIFNGERKQECITLSCLPVSRASDEDENLYAIIFSETAQNGDIDSALSCNIDHIASQRISDLEQELGEVQGKLNTSIAEQECVNEELQAANEELLTANEELQSSNEELQSVNEELYTVNSEYQQKLSELADSNDDIANFLSSTLTGIIFVDNKLNLRRYTDYVMSEFNVMEHDIGRSLKFISYHFPTVDISKICDNVLKTLVADEREVTTGKNRVFFMRVAPYRTTENKILGCVITLMDITKQKLEQTKLENTEEKLNIIRQANAARSSYLSRIVGEIDTPLNALDALAHLAKEQSDDKQALLSSLEKLVEVSGHISKIIKDIVATSDSSLLDDADNAGYVPFDMVKGASELCDLNGAKVLIAEDNALNRTILSAILRHEGISCVEACNGMEAIKSYLKAPEGSFDCILMDMRMPVLDGLCATKQIRESDRQDAKTIPIISVSATGYGDDIQKAREAGVNGYAAKPIDREKLLRAMRELIKRK